MSNVTTRNSSVSGMCCIVKLLPSGGKGDDDDEISGHAGHQGMQGRFDSG